MTQATDSTLQKPERSKKTTYQKLVQTLQNFQAYLQQTDGTEQEAIQKRIEKTAKLIANLALENQNKRDESLFGKIANKILDAKDLDTIFRTTTKELKQTLNCDRAAIYRFNPDWSGEFVAEYFEGNLVSLLEEQRYNPEIVDNVNDCSVRDLAIEERFLKPKSSNGNGNGNGSIDTYLKATRGNSFLRGKTYRICHDIHNSNFSDCYIRVLESYQAEAYVIAAVYQDNKLWGLLAAYQSQPRKWNNQEINLVVQLAKMLNIALQQKEARDRVEIQAKKLATRDRREKSLAKIVDRIRETDNLETILDITVSDIRELIKCDRTAIYRFNPDWSGQFIAESANSEWVSLLKEQSNLPEIVENVNRCSVRDLAGYEGIAGGSKQGKENADSYLQQTKGGDFVRGEIYRVCEDIYNSGFSECYVKVLERYQAKAYIIAAIYYNKQLWGLLAIYQNSSPRKWQREEIELISRFASQIGVGIRQTKYLKAIKSQNERLKQNAQKEQTLAKIFDRILQSSELQETFDNTMADLRRLLNADRAAVYKLSFDPGNKYGQFIAEDVDKNYPNAVAANKIEDRYSQNQAESYDLNTFWAVEDISKTKFKESQIKVVTQFEVKAYINVALLCDGKLWGLLCVHQCSNTRKWHQEEINLACQVASQLSIAIDRSEYVKRLEEKKEIALLVEKLTERINQSDNLSQIWQSSLIATRNIIQCDRVSIYRFNPDWSGEYVAESVGNDWIPLVGDDIKTVWEDTHLQETQGGRYRNNETFVVNDINLVGHSQCHIDVLEQFQVKAYIIAPIFAGTKLWGLLAAYQNTGPRNWNSREVGLISKLGVQFGLAVKQAESLEKLQEQNAKLIRTTETEKALGVLGERIRQTQDLDAVFNYTLSEIRDLLKCDRIVVYRFNSDWSGEIIAESFTEGWVSLMELQKSDAKVKNDLMNSDNCAVKQYGNLNENKLNDTYLQQEKGGIYSEGIRYRRVNDVDAENFSACYLESLRKFQAKAYIISPIYQGNQLWGLLAVYQNSGPRIWEDREVNLVVKIGVQYSIAVQQANYLQEALAKNQKLTQLVETEKANSRFLSQLPSRLIDLAQSTGKVGEILDYAVRNLRQLLKCDRVGIYRFDPDWSGEFIVESVGSEWPKLVGTSKARVKDTYLQENEGGRYVRRESLQVNNIYTVGHDECHINLLEEWGTKAYLIVPIFVGDLLWGLLGVYQNDQPRDWQRSELDVTVQTGIQIGTAIKLAETLEQVNKQEQQLSEIAEREKTARQQLQKNALKVLKAVQPSFSGDLTVRAPLSEDEIGTIADGYNTTIQKLRQLVGQVQKVASRISETSTDSDRLVGKLSNKSEQQVQELKKALVQLNSVVASSQTVANDAQKVEQALQDANKIVNNGDSLMEKTVDGIEEIRETVSETSKKIKRLGEASQKITKVVNLIENFATQTNLLALNAAIEATRAGEYGKGFAVVADEVRALAYQSANATTEISRIVAEIQAETTEVTETMELGITQVVQGTQLVNDTRDSLSEIVRSTNRISQLVEKITLASSVQSQQCQGLSAAMNDVSSISASTSENASSIADSFQKLLQNSQELQTSVSKFKID